MMPTLLAAAVDTVTWSPKTAIVMILCNVMAIAVAKATVQQPAVGAMPPSPEMFGGFSLGTIIGATSLGHVLGFGAIMGLTNMGML